MNGRWAPLVAEQQQLLDKYIFNNYLVLQKSFFAQRCYICCLSLCFWNVGQAEQFVDITLSSGKF